MTDDKPESGTRLTAVEIHDNIRKPAEKEIERSAAAYPLGFIFVIMARSELFTES